MDKGLEYRQFVSNREHKIQEYHAEPEVALRANNRQPRTWEVTEGVLKITSYGAKDQRVYPSGHSGTKVMRSIQRRDDFDQLLQANILHSVLRI